MSLSTRWSLRWMLPLLVLGGTLAAVMLSFVHQAGVAASMAWADTQAQAQRELALLTVIAERSGVDDTPLLAELVVQSQADPRVVHAAVLDPDGRVLVSTSLAEVGRLATDLSLAETRAAALSNLHAGGPARLTALRDLGELQAVQAFAWPGRGNRLREERPGVLLLRYDLSLTLQSIWRTSMLDHLADMALFLGAALLMFGVLARLVRQPLGLLADTAAAIGAGQLDRRVPEMPTRELDQLGQAFNRMADDLALRLQQLSDSEQRLQALVDSAPDAMLTVDAGGTIERFNHAAELLFGYSAEELIGQSMDILLPVHAVVQHRHQLALFGGEGESTVARAMAPERTVHGCHRDGRTLMLEVSISRLRVAGDWHFTAVARDVGERLANQAELERHRHHLQDLVAERTEALARSRDEAQAATRAKSEFLANMSHEIRTPMNAILGLAHLARRQASPLQLTHLDKLAGAARHLLAILNDILDFSKIEAGKLSLSSRDFDVDDMVDQACHLVCERAMAKGLEVVQRIDPSLPAHLRGDDLRLGQVLVNLIGNAVKFTDSGHVRVNLSRAQSAEGRPQVRYEVRDTGIGMDAAQQARIFQAFEQADSSTTRRFGGTGLGLSISRRLVELMGGTLRVESREGQGSRFWFDLPLEPAQSPVPGRRAVARFEGTHALVVDDLEAARLVLTEMLEMLGLRVTAVATGEQALHALVQAQERGDACELCVLDWQMPGMDGVETARQVRALPLERQPAFLMISAMGGQVPQAALAEIGFAGVLAKPVSPSQLHDVLTRALRRDEPVLALAGPAAWMPDARARVLLVEDNPLNREVSAQLLEAVGLSPDLAHDGAVAVEMARQSHYDLILMDVQMPVMDGLEAARQIRQLPGHARTAIVAMTANAFEEDRERCRAAGMDDFVSKPVDPNDLDRALRRWLTPTMPVEPAGPDDPPAAEVRAAPPGGQLDLAFALHTVRGNQAVLARLLQVYAEQHAADGTRLLATWAERRMDRLSEQLHKIKGAVGTFGARALVARIQALEATLAQGRPVDDAAVQAVLVDLDSLHAEVQAALVASVPRPRT